MIFENQNNIKSCSFCGTDFESSPDRLKFCGHSCAAKFNNRSRECKGKKLKCINCSTEHRAAWNANPLDFRCTDCKKIIFKKRRTEANKVFYKNHREELSRIRKCRYCQSVLEYQNKQKFCSDICRANFIDKKAGFNKYKDMCKFVFDLKRFPEEFSFDLINKYGFYSPSNKNNNLNGVSKDHMVSVKYGFENKIDPRIISHPANCQLMTQNENTAKSDKCSLTLAELLDRMNQWDERYKI